MTEERDLAHEADMERLRREQLRADISPEEAAEECAEIEARAAWMEGADLDDGSELLGDPDEHDFDVCSRCGADDIEKQIDAALAAKESEHDR